MKKHLFFTVVLTVGFTMLAGSFALLAQVPQSFKYQAVARDAAGAMMANQELNFEISILKGDPSGEVVFAEQHTDTTNQFGLVTLDIGRGNVFTGDFSSIAWGDDTYFLMVEMEGIYVGIMQLLSVPYALHAQTVSVDKVDDADADPLNEIQSLSLNGNDLTLSDGGGSVTLPTSAGGGDNWDTQTVVSDATISGAGTTSDPLGVVHGEIKPDWEDIQGMPADFSDNTDDVDDVDHDTLNEIQTLSLSGTLLTLSKEGGTVTLPSSGGGDNWGTQTVVTDATLSGNGTTATPLKIARQTATTGQVMKWNGTSWAPADDDTGGGGFSLPYSGTTTEGTYGINIEHTTASGANYGGKFKSASTTGVGVYGQASANNGNAWGVHGESNSVTGSGVFGHSLAGSGESFGVVGTSESGEGAGVLGTNYSSSGTAICGIKGKVSSSSGYSGHFTGGRFHVDGNVGIGTDSPAALLHTKGIGTGQGNVLFEGNFKASNPGDPPVSGAGTRMMWYPDKAAFRAGIASGTQWDDTNIGSPSIAMGNSTTASGANSIAIGFNAIASETYSIALGYSATASGTYSIALGRQTFATGGNSTTMGYSNTASGDYSVTMGYRITAPSAFETVTGVYNTDYTPERTNSFHTNDRLFVIGNGTASSSRSNAMTVLKNGNVGIGPDNPAYKLDLLGELNIQSEDPGDKAIFVNSTEALWYDGTYFSWGYGADYNYFARDVTIGTNADPGAHLLVVNGTAAKPGGGIWATWSDLHLKEIHENYVKGLEEIAALSPVTFSYKEDNPLMLPDDQEYVGLVAQDVQEIFPEAVSEGKDGYLQLDLHPVNIALINAVRELKRQNDELRKRIEALENN